MDAKVSVITRPIKRERLVIVGCDFNDLDLHSLDLDMVLQAAEKQFPGKIVWIRDGVDGIEKELMDLRPFWREGTATSTATLQVGPLRIECMCLSMPLLH